MVNVNALKKLLCVIVACSIVISCFTMQGFGVLAGDNDIDYWSGETTPPTKGSGTLADPYLIETPEEFAYMMLEANGGAGYDNGAVYKLMNDIYLNDISRIDWRTGKAKAGYTPMQWKPEIFSGIIYGEGHMVYGMYIENNPTSYFEKWGGGSGAALISENWSNKWIQINDMGMDCVYVNSENVSAVFVAGANSNNIPTARCQFNGCYIGNDVTVKGFATGGFYGGGFGNQIDLKLKNCVCLAQTFSDNGRGKHGGMVGDMWGSDNDSIENCYSIVPIYGNNAMGGTYAHNYSTLQTTVANTKTNIVPLSNMQGPDALTNLAKMPSLGDGFVATTGFPVPKAFLYTLGEGSSTPGKVWNGTVAYPAKGTGTVEDPFEIATAEQLAWAIASNGNANFILTADIFLNDIDKIDWTTGTPVEGYTPNEWYSSDECAREFCGSINGNGHVIYGLYYNKTKPTDFTGNIVTGYGLIPQAYKVEITGLGIDKAYMQAYTNYSFGAFAGNGQIHGMSGYLEKCFVGADVTMNGYDTGAFIGGGQLNKRFKITDCYSLANITYEHRGGLVGDCWSNDYEMRNVFTTSGKLMGNYKPIYSENCYTTEACTGAQNISASAMQGDLMSGNVMVLGNAFKATEGYPVLKAFVGETEGWNGLAEPFTAGDGASEATAYEIATVGQLAHAVALGSGKYYKLVKDIVINDINKIDWKTGLVLDETYTPLTWFFGTDASAAKYNGFSANMQWSGTLDGNGHVIYGLWYSPEMTETTAGLIPGVSSGTIKNLELSDSYVVGGRFVGAISSTFAGTADKIAIGDTVTVISKKNVAADSYSTGGLFGYTNGVTIRNCGFYGKLSGFNHVYGLIGTSWGSKIDVANSFSIGYQPFTVSSPAKSYSTTQEEALQSALAHFQSLYKVDKVYTDTKKTGNRGTYKYEVDGEQTTAYCDVFSFVNLAYKDITGPSALENMPGVPTDVWYATDSYPRTTNWAEYSGDTNLDGQPALTDDLLAVRNQILGIAENNNTDMNRDGEVNVCDLVAMWNKCPTRYKSNGEPYLLKHWMGYKKAKIVYAVNDAEAKTAAESFKTKMAEKGLNLAVYADTALSATQYEVLFGNTNRGLFDSAIGDGRYTITVNGCKIVFSSGKLSDTDAGNRYTNAINDFTKLYEDGFAPTLTGFHTYEGSVSLKTALYGSSSKTYTAVWGDEFYGTDLNQYKWDCNINRSHMGSYPDMVLLDDDETVNVAEGRLRMTAKQYSVDGNEAVKFAAPASVHTKGLMEYKYGYVEIRAKVPFRTGIWPSFWMKADTVLGGRANYDYMVEIDMFEVFGNTSQLASNIHKWYTAQGKAKYGLTDSQTHIMHRDDATGNWLGNILDKWTNGEDTVTVSGTPENWHTYGMGWDANYLYMYVDQTLFKKYAISGSSAAKNNFGSDAANRDSDMSGFHDPLYVIFNNHIFTENASWRPSNNVITGSESNLPAHYDIDYFRLYQASDSGTALYTN